MGPTNAGGEVMDALIAEISRDMRMGASLAEVEATVIDPAPLDGDQKAALWMYAWSLQTPTRRRHEALEQIVALEKDRGSGRLADD